MTLPLTPTSPFTDDQSVVTAAVLNAWRTAINQAGDLTAGGAYAPTSKLQLGGSGLELTETAGAAKSVQLASRARTKVFPLLGHQASGTWVKAVGAGHVWNNTANAGSLLHLDMIDPPNGQLITSVSVSFTGAGGHAAFPGGAPTMPTIQLWRLDYHGVAFSLGTQADTMATAGTYEVAHSITLSGLAVTIDITAYRYVVAVTAESGGNYLANATVNGLSGAFTITSLPEF